jgi:hypothetical protein
MPRRPSSTTREFLALYSRAGHGEYNLGAFLREHRELLASVDAQVDLEQDDAALALALAPFVGRYRKYMTRNSAAERNARAERAASRLAGSARHGSNCVALDVDVLLGDALAGTHKYIALELDSVRVSVLRHTLLRARGALKVFPDLTAYVDERGLHLAWRAGRGGLNLPPQREEREALRLLVDLQRPRTPTQRGSGAPVPLAEVLVELGFM